MKYEYRAVDEGFEIYSGDKSIIAIVASEPDAKKACERLNEFDGTEPKIIKAERWKATKKEL